MKSLRQALSAAAALDAVCGAPLLVAPQWAATTLGISLHGEMGFRLLGLALLMLAGFGGYAAQDPFRYVGNVIVMIAGRAAGGVMLLLAALSGGAAPAFVGLAELCLAALQAWLGRDLPRGARPR